MSKFLDNTGLSHLWSKIKSYLISWKSENFGSGTYNNRGNFNIATSKSNFQIDTGGNIITRGHNSYGTYKTGMQLTTTSSATTLVDDIGVNELFVAYGLVSYNGGVDVYLDSGETLHYVIIGENGIKHGDITRTESTNGYKTITNVGGSQTPYIAMLTKVR